MSRETGMGHKFAEAGKAGEKPRRPEKEEMEITEDYLQNLPEITPEELQEEEREITPAEFKRLHLQEVRDMKAREKAEAEERKKLARRFRYDLSRRGQKAALAGENVGIKDVLTGIDAEKLLLSGETIRPDDMENYAEIIADRIAAVKASGQPVTMLIIDSLKLDNVKEMLERKHGKKHELTDAEVEAVLAPIRKAMIEKISGKVDEKFYFAVKELGKRGGMHAQVTEISNIYGQTSVLRKENTEKEMRRVLKNSREVEAFIKQRDDALKRLSEMAPHSNILRVRKVAEGGIHVDKYDGKDLRGMLTDDEGRPNYDKIMKTSAAECFGFVRDCVTGAIQLEKGGLVLQDIHLGNVGIHEENGKTKGMLFDLGGLGLEGEELRSRMMLNEKYLAPETKRDWKLHVKEMVYQFGRTLEQLYEVVDYFPDIVKLHRMDKSAVRGELRGLLDRATENDPEERLTLKELEAGLSEIIDTIKEEQAEHAKPEKERKAA